MVAASRDAHFALTRAKYAAGEKITSVILVATDRASARVRVRAENIAGVEVRAFDEVRSVHWSPYDRVGVVNADP